MQKCPLCNSNSELFFQKKTKIYYICQNCKGIFIDKNLLPDSNTEFMRYKKHNNNVEDSNYQNFSLPIVNSVLNDFSASDKGLDFGSGENSAANKLLKDKNYNIEQFDPFFHNNTNLLTVKYDYIICCEVIEHFHFPKNEFNLLHSLLKNNGKLYLMTNIYEKNINFENWYYKNDITHVFFYQKETFDFIEKEYNFSNKKIINNLIIFSV